MKKKTLLIVLIAVVVVALVVATAALWPKKPQEPNTADPGQAALTFTKLIHNAETDEALKILPGSVVEQYLQKNQRDFMAWRNTIDGILQSRKKFYASKNWTYDETLLSVEPMEAGQLTHIQAMYQNEYGVTVTDGKIVRVAENLKVNDTVHENALDFFMLQINNQWCVDFQNMPNVSQEGIFDAITNIGGLALDPYVTAIQSNDAVTMLSCYPTTVVDLWLTQTKMTRTELIANAQKQMDDFTAKLTAEKTEWRWVEECEASTIPLTEWYALRETYRKDYGVEMEDANLIDAQIAIRIDGKDMIESPYVMEDVYIVKINGQWYLDVLNPPALPVGNIFAVK